jgi:hypothetical protein
MKRLFLALSLTLPVFGGEFVVLGTGYRLHADRHESEGAKVRLYQKDGGFFEMDAALVVGFEKEIEPPAAVPSPVVVADVIPPVVQRTHREMVESAALKNGLPPNFVHSVVSAESGYRPDAVSPKGAIGLMQLMPATARQYGVRNAYKEAANLDAGVRHLKMLLDRFAVREAIAAYNAGEAAVLRFGGVPPFRETRAYVERVLALAGLDIAEEPPAAADRPGS